MIRLHLRHAVEGPVVRTSASFGETSVNGAPLSGRVLVVAAGGRLGGTVMTLPDTLSSTRSPALKPGPALDGQWMMIGVLLFTTVIISEPFRIVV